jgi:uncharacterized protein with von Willebrand factor type A (vWA) domain
MSSQLGDIADRKSPAYYIVMRAQEREVWHVHFAACFPSCPSLAEQELQRFGDEKELAVKKTEREIRALRSTLERLNSKNQRFKQSFTKVEGDSEDVAEMEQLQPVIEAVSDRRRQARTEVEHLSGDVASMQGSLGNLMQETASIDRQVQGLRRRVDSVQVCVLVCAQRPSASGLTLVVQAEVSEHSSKVDRARQMEKKMTEAFRKRVQATPGVVTAEEEDIKLQGFKESVNELLTALLTTVEDNPELKGKVGLLVVRRDSRLTPWRRQLATTHSCSRCDRVL